MACFGCAGASRLRMRDDAAATPRAIVMCQRNRLWNSVSEGSRKSEPDDHGQAIGEPMTAGNLARWTARLTEGVSGSRGANAQDSRGRDKRKLQIHAILPRSSNADSGAKSADDVLGNNCGKFCTGQLKFGNVHVATRRTLESKLSFRGAREASEPGIPKLLPMNSSGFRISPRCGLSGMTIVMI